MEDKKKILVIEDDNLLVEALKKALGELDVELTFVLDGETGLSIALETKPDLILLDLVLPKMDGVTLFENLREDTWGKTVKVIVLTNLSSPASVNDFKEKGVNNYLIKSDWKIHDIVNLVERELNLK